MTELSSHIEKNENKLYTVALVSYIKDYAIPYYSPNGVFGDVKIIKRELHLIKLIYDELAIKLTPPSDGFALKNLSFNEAENLINLYLNARDYNINNKNCKLIIELTKTQDEIPDWGLSQDQIAFLYSNDNYTSNYTFRHPDEH